MKEAVMV